MEWNVLIEIYGRVVHFNDIYSTIREEKATEEDDESTCEPKE